MCNVRYEIHTPSDGREKRLRIGQYSMKL